jgi:hypothetical protein
MSLTLAAAAAVACVNKTTFLRAVKAGKVSGNKDEHGQSHIARDAARRHRGAARNGRARGRDRRLGEVWSCTGDEGRPLEAGIHVHLIDGLLSLTLSEEMTGED